MNITTEIDSLIDDTESAGVTWYVLDGMTYPGPCLAFELPSNNPLPGNALAAMMNFDRQFRTSAEIRKAVIECAVAIGAAYQEAQHMIMSDP